MNHQYNEWAYPDADIRSILASGGRVPDDLIRAIDEDITRRTEQARSRPYEWTPVKSYADSVIAGNTTHELNFDLYVGSSGRLGWAREHHHIHEVGFRADRLTPLEVGNILTGVLREQPNGTHFFPGTSRFVKINDGLVKRILADVRPS